MPFSLLQTVVVPVMAGLSILGLPSEKARYAGWIALLALLYTTALMAAAGFRVAGGNLLREFYPLGPQVSFDLLMDGLSLPTAIIVNGICAALACYSFAYVDHRIELIYGRSDSETWAVYYKRFFFLFLFFPAGFAGVAFSTNLIALYFFLELLTVIPLYFIMAQFGYSDYMSRYRVAMMSLYWGVAGATLFLIGILMAFTRIGSFEVTDLPLLAGDAMAFWIAIVILISLFMKLAVVPVHVWMPWVHAEHPTCIAGLLAIYANIAVYVIVRVLFVPLGDALRVFSAPIMALAFITMTYGALLTLAQSDAKRFCACSTISQISYSLFGIGAMTALGMQGGMFYFYSHTLGKAVLFSTAGILVYTLETRDLTKMSGLGRKMPLTAALWFSSALILSALPPFSGFVGKWLLFAGAFERFSGSLPGLVFTTAAVLSTLLTLVYTFVTGTRLFFGPEHTGASHIPPTDPSLTMSLPLVLLTAAALFLGLYPDPVLELLQKAIASAG